MEAWERARRALDMKNTKKRITGRKCFSLFVTTSNCHTPYTRALRSFLKAETQ